MGGWCDRAESSLTECNEKLLDKQQCPNLAKCYVKLSENRLSVSSVRKVGHLKGNIFLNDVISSDKTFHTTIHKTFYISIENAVRNRSNSVKITILFHSIPNVDALLLD